MSGERVPNLARVPLSAATLGTVRRMLVARLSPEILNPFARTPDNEALLRRTIGEILAEPELDLDASPAFIASVEAVVCGLGPLQPLVDDPEVGDILVNGRAISSSSDRVGSRRRA